MRLNKRRSYATIKTELTKRYGTDCRIDTAHKHVYFYNEKKKAYEFEFWYTDKQDLINSFNILEETL